MKKSFTLTFLKQLQKKYQKGDAREESYYGILESLLKNYADHQLKKKIDITVLPKKTEAGNPDFRIWDGKQDVVGYIEAKDIGKDLDPIEDTEQLKRYLKTFPNVILTNFTEFRLYRDGKEIDKIFIAYHKEITKLHTTPVLYNEEKFIELLNKFFAFSLPKTFTAKTLAVELAKRTRFLKDEIISSEIEMGNEEILGFYEAFKEYLIAGLSKEEFADLYSQTITYGLFAARLRAGKNFNRRDAFKYIPKTIGILRDVFRFISGAELPDQMETIVDDISAVLAAAEAKKILDHYYREGKGSDPVLHFYETFLAEYDPTTRAKRGVYYTPEPVVSFIVRSLHIILKEQFNKPLGLADKGVTLLDPASGTLSFNFKAIQIAVEEFVSKYGEGGRKKFIKDHILENYYAFELMMAPYAIGHMKLSFLLEELGYVMKDEERAKSYLTNTLEMKELEDTKLPGMSSLSHESHEAGKVKKDVPILVVHGNPPYSVSSSNIIKEGSNLHLIYESYKEKVRKVEKNIQPLSDDYIKFISFAHYKLSQVDYGIVGLITNNSYLSGLIHRGMRENLTQSFNEIYILNLHGNSRIGEKTPEGNKDENVFDIRQGVSIVFFVKKIKYKGKTDVFYYDCWGIRNDKYEFLNKNDIKSLKWIRIDPEVPDYFFIKKDFANKSNYAAGMSIDKIFNIFSSGVKTHRDHFITSFNEKELSIKMNDFISKVDNSIIEKAYNLKDTRDWKLDTARKKLKETGWKEYLRYYDYRPFDCRNICYSIDLIDSGTSRFKIMKNFFQDNVGLSTIRSEAKVGQFNHTFVTKLVSDIHYIGGQSYIFPLYIYPEIDKKDLFSEHEPGKKKPNIKPSIFAQLKKNFKKEVTPEEIFYYIYGILYSNTYRQKYAEFLKIDFPRIPFTSNYKLFIQLGKFGKQLADLHLLKSEELNKPISKYSGKGDNKVTIRPKWDNKIVYINSAQYFTNVKEEVWKYHIGGYQVCDKWLKDRKDRELSLEEIQTYCKIVTVLSKTIQLQEKIDEIYNDVEK
ncbi:MAG: N-6 DNA methylase [Bacteroidetes bacterium]|nr:N-6 DNA methylase [Bacteroidota bacterium]